MIRNKFIGALSAVFALGVAGMASASVYDWSFKATDGTLLADGKLNADSAGAVTSLTGVVEGVGSISYTPGAGIDGVFQWDNTVTKSAPHVDFSGILFQAGGLEWNIYNGINGSVPTGYFPNGDTLANNLNNYGGTVGTFGLTAVPEPTTWAMLILGLGMIGFAARRREVASALTA